MIDSIIWYLHRGIGSYFSFLNLIYSMLYGNMEYISWRIANTNDGWIISYGLDEHQNINNNNNN